MRKYENLRIDVDKEGYEAYRIEVSACRYQHRKIKLKMCQTEEGREHDSEKRMIF